MSNSNKLKILLVKPHKGHLKLVISLNKHSKFNRS